MRPVKPIIKWFIGIRESYLTPKASDDGDGEELAVTAVECGEWWSRKVEVRVVVVGEEMGLCSAGKVFEVWFEWELWAWVGA